MKQSIASGIYSSFIAPTTEEELLDSAQKMGKRHASIGVGKATTRNTDFYTANNTMIENNHRNKVSQTPKSEKGMLTFSQTIQKNGPFTKSIRMGDTMSTGGLAVNNKFEMSKTVAGQSVGGPKKGPNLTMWDMMTLYDTQKKKVEDQAAYFAYKKQQQELKEFYEKQKDFKSRVNKMQSQRRDLELATIKNKHDNLFRYENNFDNNKRNHLANLQKENRSNTLEAKRQTQPTFNQTFKTGFLKKGDLMNGSPMKSHEMMSRTIVGN